MGLTTLKTRESIVGGIVVKMNDSGKSFNEPTGIDIEGRLDHLGDDMGTEIHMTLNELLCDYYPDLTQKEIVICKMIIHVYWYLGLTFYCAIVSTSAACHKKLFRDEKEVEATIKQLIEKGVLKCKTYFLWVGGSLYCDSNSCERRFLRPTKLLDLNRDIEYEGFMIISNQFSSNVEGASSPVKSEEAPYYFL